MSHIRVSTIVPGQRNASRTYSWSDIRGGVVITARPFGEGGCWLSHPEALYWAKSIIDHVKRDRRPGETLEKVVGRWHRREKFYANFDKAHTAEVKKGVAKWQRKIRANKLKHARDFKKLLARMKKNALDRTVVSNVEEAKRLLTARGWKVEEP